MTVFAGDKTYASDVNPTYDGTLAKPVGRIRQSGAQTGIASNTLTAVTFTTEDFDSHNFHSTSVNTDRVTPTVPGVYQVDASVALAAASDYTVFEVVITLNGTAIAPAHRIGATFQNTSMVLPASAKVTVNGSSDYFGVQFRATKTAGTVATVVSSQFASVLEWEYLRPAVP